MRMGAGRDCGRARPGTSGTLEAPTVSPVFGRRMCLGQVLQELTYLTADGTHELTHRLVKPA